MGMCPSADLSYGIDIGEWEWGEPEEGEEPELPWLTWELWKKSWELETASATYLKANGVEGVQVTNYGHPDHPKWVLATRIVGCWGWGETTTVTPETLAVTDDDERLAKAWKLLFGDREQGPIAWRLSATFG